MGSLWGWNANHRLRRQTETPAEQMRAVRQRFGCVWPQEGLESGARKSSIIVRSGTEGSDKTDGQQARKVDSRQDRVGAETGQQFGGKTNRIEMLEEDAKVSGRGCRMQNRWLIIPWMETGVSGGRRSSEEAIHSAGVISRGQLKTPICEKSEELEF